MLIWIRNTSFVLANLRISDLRMGHQANLRICNLLTGAPQKFEDFRLRNEPKNVRICDLRTDKKKFRACVF
jgi:hypothetical protein